MGSRDPSKMGRNLCSRCYQYYLDKSGTVRRSSASVPQGMQGSETHQRAIHKHVAQAQRGRE
jgi:hypothetical protein